MRTLVCLPLLAALAACSTSSDEMAWARAALERNGELEIVAEDSDARTFTVRERNSRELRVVGVDEIVATLADATAPMAGSASAAASPADAGSLAETPAPTEPAATPPPDETVAQAPERARQPAAAVGSGRVIASGPGYTIQAGEQASPSARGDAEPAGGALERRTEPLICQGSRFMRIDRRNIAFEGDALVAEEGCEMHVTNSRITAGGVGVAVRNSNVHITNSTVSGRSGAIQASGNAQIYARSSRFRGMVRRLDDAVVHDMGENVWN